MSRRREVGILDVAPEPDAGRRRVIVCLMLLSAWYLAATLPYLTDYPLLDWPQMGIAAPAWKLANEGVYGNDLFAGYFGTELRNYEYMPAYPWLVAVAFEVLGLGVFPARLVSVACGWLTLLLTFHLGRRLYGPAVGLLAAALLAALRLGLLPAASGIPLVDFGRVIRYDILVPVGVLAASLCFLRAAGEEAPPARARGAAFLAAGALAGVATLAHVYGAFILGVFAAVLGWHRGWRALREPPLYLLAAGWLLALLPWILYVFQDLEAYRGQMSRHAGRFELLDPGFYWQNLLREPWRYAPWLKGGLPATLLRPRLGIWWLLLGVPAGMAVLWRRARRSGERAQKALPDRFLLLALPVLGLCLGLLISLKRHAYTVLVLPFLALVVAVWIVEVWCRAGGRKRWRQALVLLGVLTVVEGGVAVARTLRAAGQASPYLELCRKIAEKVPAGSRLLISQPYWLGLEEQGDFELRSINLVFVRAASTSVDQALAELAPDAVVIEQYFLAGRSADPRGPPADSEAKRTFLEIRAYLERSCSEQVEEIPDPDYGTVEVYRCR